MAKFEYPLNTKVVASSVDMVVEYLFSIIIIVEFKL
jgi:hypothetical protein